MPKKQPIKKNVFEMNISIKGVSLAQKALFAKHLSVMLQSGMPILEALDISIESNQGLLRKILKRVRESVKTGRSLSDSFSSYPKVFSELFVNVVRAGEMSGTLVENLENVADELKKEKELVEKIKGAMLYPIIVLVATFILGIVLSFFVLPKITPLFEGFNMELPMTTQFLIWFSEKVQTSGVLMFGSLVGFVVLFSWVIGQKFSKPATHWVLLRVPIISVLTRNANLARFSRTLGMLLRSGVTINEALDITKDAMGNYYFQRALEKTNRRAGKGAQLAESLENSSSLFPKLLTKMIHVGEESGKLEETLMYLSELYESELDTATKSLSTAIEPLLLIVIGLVVGFLALSIITPIYSITGSIGN